ncbi:MAG TPA: hypothetical protein VFS40_10540 [Gemmatimonadales bacterium]|nr:hypothetical protein [Gemmatimonadales bacterium]
MGARHVVAGAALALLVTGCGGRRAVELNPDQAVVGSRWNAILATPAGLAGVVQVQGEAWMGAGTTPGQTIASVTIRNAAPGGEHPWHVHRGQCGNDLGIFGPADAYGQLDVGSSGSASATATLPVPLPDSGAYMVNVHASRANMGTIIACGNLAPPIR